MQWTVIVSHNRNYEHIVKAHQNNPQQGEDQVSDQVKFNIFQSIMDSLFLSFSNSVSVSSFQELSACVFSWIEEHCKPQVRNIFDTLSWFGVLDTKTWENRVQVEKYQSFPLMLR